MKPLIVKCPCCGIELDIDRRSGKIVRTGPKPDDADRDRFADAFESVKKQSKRTATAFDQANAALRERQSQLDDVFKDAVKKVKETDDGSRPVNPFDMD